MLENAISDEQRFSRAAPFLFERLSINGVLMGQYDAKINSRGLFSPEIAVWPPRGGFFLYCLFTKAPLQGFLKI